MNARPIQPLVSDEITMPVTLPTTETVCQPWPQQRIAPAFTQEVPAQAILSSEALPAVRGRRASLSLVQHRAFGSKIPAADTLPMFVKPGLKALPQAATTMMEVPALSFPEAPKLPARPLTVSLTPRHALPPPPLPRKHERWLYWVAAGLTLLALAVASAAVSVS